MIEIISFKNFKSHIALFSIALVAILILIFFGLFSAKVSIDYKKSSDNLLNQAARFQWLIDNGSLINEAMLESEGILRSVLNSNSADPLVIGTNLQQTVREIANASGLEVQGSQIITPRIVDSLEMITVSTTLNGNLEALDNFLQQVYQVRPMIMLEQISLRPTRAVGSRRQGVSAEQDVQVQLQLTTPRVIR